MKYFHSGFYFYFSFRIISIAELRILFFGVENFLVNFQESIQCLNFKGGFMVLVLLPDRHVKMNLGRPPFFSRHFSCFQKNRRSYCFCVLSELNQMRFDPILFLKEFSSFLCFLLVLVFLDSILQIY